MTFVGCSLVGVIATTALFVSVCGCGAGKQSATDGGGPQVNYTFDNGTEGWVLDKREGSSFTNLGASVPDGGSPPTVSFAESDGDPSPGSLRLAVAFTAPWQYVAAGVVLGQARDLSGKTLHARVRLLSGLVAGVWAGLYACGTSCAEEGAIDAAELAGGAWAPLALDLNVAATHVPIGALPPNFDPASVVELGIEVYTVTSVDGGAADGGASVSTGDLVFEIDAVTE